MLNIDKLKKGDIILCANICSAVIIDIFIPGTYHHAFIYTGNNMCIDFYNKKLEHLSIYKTIHKRRSIKILRHIDPLEAYLAVRRAFRALNNNTVKYSVIPFKKTKYCFSFVNYCYNYIFEKSKIFDYILASSILNHPSFVVID